MRGDVRAAGPVVLLTAWLLTAGGLVLAWQAAEASPGPAPVPVAEVADVAGPPVTYDSAAGERRPARLAPPTTGSPTPAPARPSAAASPAAPSTTAPGRSSPTPTASPSPRTVPSPSALPAPAPPAPTLPTPTWRAPAVPTRPVPTPAVPTPTAPTSAGPRDRRVFVVGDSLTQGSATDLPARLRARGYEPTVDAALGRHTDAGVRLVREQGSGLAGTVVVALGTNDEPAPTRFRGQVEQVLAAAGPSRCVVWVNLVRPGGWDALNTVLTDVAARQGRLRLVDWRGLVAAHPEWLAADGVHATTAGYRARAEAVTAAVAGCP
jgi:lysophospholipase L1-like esterase